jgi:hypothetical protein
MMMKMTKISRLGLIVLVGLLTGCGSHLSAGLLAGRQTPSGVSGRNGISIQLNSTSEVQLNPRGFRMGLAPRGEAPLSVDPQPGPTPWLSYHFYF